MDDDLGGRDLPPNVTHLSAVRAEAASAKWSKRLVLGQDDRPVPSLQNAVILLGHHPMFAGLVGFNEFKNAVQLMRAPPAADDGLKPPRGPFPRSWRQSDINCVALWFQRMFNNAGWTTGIMEQAMVTVAEGSPFHPARDWFDGLKHDGTSRLDDAVEKIYGAVPPPEDMKDQEAVTRWHNVILLRRVMFSKFLIAAVRRVRKPGCKFDPMLVLEGDQGLGKSQSLAALFDPWFSDDLGDIQGKDGPMSLRGQLCVEVAELDALMRHTSDKVKAFISRQRDVYRVPYGRDVEDFPRQCVLAGTTNRAEYLRDETGARRFWPVFCHMVDLDWIVQNREQLWAEAAAREAAGEVIYIDDVDLRETATEEQADRSREDPWAPKVWEHIDSGNHTFVEPVKILTDVVQIPVGQQMTHHLDRVKAILVAGGWVPKRGSVVQFSSTLNKEVRTQPRGYAPPAVDERRR